MFSSALLCGAGFLVGFGCDVALCWVGDGAGGGGTGSGGVGSGGCAWGGVGGADGGGGAVSAAGAGFGGGTGVGGVGNGGAAACGAGGGGVGGGGGGGGASIGCGFGGWVVCGAGVGAGEGDGAGTGAGAGACTDVAAVPSNTIDTAVSGGSSGGLVNGMPMSSSARTSRWIATETMAPRRSAGGIPAGRLPGRLSPCSTRWSTRRPHPAFGLAALGAGAAGGAGTDGALAG